MKLKTLPFKDGISKGVQVRFGGLNRGLGAGDGELADMKNLTSDHFPLLASRAPRVLFKRLWTEPAGARALGGLFAHEELCWVDGDGFFYGGVFKGSVAPGEKVISAVADYIVIMPDKVFYNVFLDKFGSMESVWSGASLTFTHGLLFEEAAECNTLHAPGVVWSDYFRVGDAVTVAGATLRPGNNKTAVIREISGDKLFFYEYVFVLDGVDGDVPYTESGALSVSRLMPDLLYVCENENRLWGCDERTIFCSALGDIFNFNVFDGLDSDSWAVDVGSPGRFTACVSYMGHPVFFKEDQIYKVFGTMPSNFELIASATLGVAEGCSRSLAIAGETLFYLSRAGVVSYSGGIPRTVGEAFGTELFRDGVGGSDNLKYYVSMRRADVPDTRHRLFVYDTLRGLWHVEDELRAAGFALWRGRLYFLNQDGEIWAVRRSENDSTENVEFPVEWSVEFADWTDDDPNRKGFSKLQIRLELEPNAFVDIYMMFDSENFWRKVYGTLNPSSKRSYYLPITPRRADHYRLKMEGSGGCLIYSLVRERYSGSENVNNWK